MGREKKAGILLRRGINHGNGVTLPQIRTYPINCLTSIKFWMASLAVWIGTQIWDSTGTGGIYDAMLGIIGIVRIAEPAQNAIVTAHACKGQRARRSCNRGVYRRAGVHRISHIAAASVPERHAAQVWAGRQLTVVGKMRCMAVDANPIVAAVGIAKIMFGTNHRGPERRKCRNKYHPGHTDKRYYF